LRGIEVRHLIDQSHSETATPTSFGRIMDGNVIHYPPAPEDQMGFDF
jgi:hypothetical protein